MTEDRTAQRPLRTQAVEIQGKPFVLVSKPDFDRLCRQAEGPRADASAIARDSVGPDLRARRRQARRTLAEVAGCAGIREETLSRIENGRTNPTVATVRAILRALEGGAGA